MTCHDAREQLSTLIDDALGAEERSAVEAHLATCAECRRELERLRGTVALLRAVEPVRAPAGFVDRVLGAARPVPWPRRLVRALLLPWPVKLPVEAAAIVLVAVGIVYVFRATPELQQASRFEATPPVATAPREIAPEPPSPDVNQKAVGTLEGARRQDKDQGPNQQAPEKRALEKRAPEKKVAPATRAFTETGPPPKEAELRGGKLDDASRDVAKRQKDVRPATPAEPQVAGKLEESPRADALQAQRPAATPPAVISLVPPDVSGRLAVTDRDAALQSLARLIARLGGVEDRRFVGDEGPIIELTIAREAYPEFLRELAGIGRWQVTREAPALPEKVRIVLRIAG
jgi:hypothetical protein